ncbi:Uncharacterized protein APZ42_022947 [Daphnia magna]|uniref:Uncharacterized protein n=1 Tax=Daphnia magna TaxID=35525 RepID=A0A164VBU7_9CRUS|nr:Uncharacterized protein APZ42_022947 [Daphnia magna]
MNQGFSIGIVDVALEAVDEADEAGDSE